MKKTILALIATMLFLTGCNSTSSQCQEQGYRGVVVFKDHGSANICCSDGKLSPNGENFITNDGDRNIENYIYAEFKKGTK